MSWFTRHIHLGNLATGIVLGAVMQTIIASNPNAPTMFDVVSPTAPELNSPADQIVQQALTEAHARLEIAKAKAEAAIITAQAEEDEAAISQINQFEIARLKSGEQKRRENHQQFADKCDMIVKPDAGIDWAPCLENK